MIQNSVIRPQASDEKIRTSDNFELCYLRHQYFRRVKYNPTEKEMQPYIKIVEHLTKNTFFTYFNLFKAVGMYHDDILSIGRVHLVSFLGLYSLEKNKEKREEYIDRIIKYEFRTPDEADFNQKNKANFTLFFKQRMEDLVRVCRQKVRNIKGQQSEEYSTFCGKQRPPKYIRSILDSYEEIGYKKISSSVFKSIRKKANVNHDASIFKYDNTWYVSIVLEQKNLNIEDIIGSGSNPYENIHNMQPDDVYVEKMCYTFDKKSSNEKQNILRDFIAKNEFNGQYKQEIITAKKLLRSL
jgi:hypothetical protein